MPHHETVYEVVGGPKYKAFSADVSVRDTRAATGRRFSFAVYADDKLLAFSGFMAPGDEPRLLVANGLADAEQIRFVSRCADGSNVDRAYLIWGNPKLYKK
jgi:hypothetical protein